MKRVVCIASLGVLLLSGCAAYQRQQAQAAAIQQGKVAKAALAAAGAQCESFYANTAIDPVRAHINTGTPESASLAQLADSTIPSTSDLPAIDAFEHARRLCADVVLHVVMDNFPDTVVRAVEGSQTRSWGLARDLYARKITYGEFNSGRADSVRQMHAELRKVEEQAREQAAEEQHADEERQKDRQEEALAILGAAAAARPAPAPIVQYVPVPPVQLQQPMLNPVTTTNCQQYGSTTRCMTY